MNMLKYTRLNLKFVIFNFPKRMKGNNKRISIKSQLQAPCFIKKDEVKKTFEDPSHSLAGVMKVKTSDNKVYEELIQTIKNKNDFLLKTNNFHPILIRTFLSGIKEKISHNPDTKCYVIVEKDEDVTRIIESVRPLGDLKVSSILDQNKDSSVTVINYKKYNETLQQGGDTVFLLYQITRYDMFQSWLQEIRFPVDREPKFYFLNDEFTATKISKKIQKTFHTLNTNDNNQLLNKCTKYYLIDIDKIQVQLVTYVSNLTQKILSENEGKCILVICDNEEETEKIKYRRNKKNIKFITVVHRNYLSGIIKTDYDYIVEVPFKSIEDFRTRRKFLNKQSKDESIGHYILYKDIHLEQLESIGLGVSEPRKINTPHLKNKAQPLTINPNNEGQMMNNLLPLISNEGKYEEVYNNIKNNDDLIEKIVCSFLNQHEEIIFDLNLNKNDLKSKGVNLKQTSLTSHLTKEDKNYLLKFAVDHKLMTYEDIKQYTSSTDQLVVNLCKDKYDHIKTIAKDKGISLL